MQHFARTVIAGSVKAVPPLPNRVRHLLECLFYERYFFDSSSDRKMSRLFRGVYATWDEALRSLPKTCHAGSDSAEQHRITIVGHRRMYQRDYPVLFWLSTLLTDRMRIFDLGGSVGITFYTFQKYLTYPEGMEWKVCEQPGVVQAGKLLAERESSRGLSFTTNFEDANGADVLIIAGALHYIETPLALLLGSLKEKPRHILLNKLPLSDGAAFVTVTHYAGGGFTPYHVFSRLPFIDSVREQGYELIDDWRNPDVSLQIPFHPDRSVSEFSGLYFKLDR
jgi:putative methyltransferase (TIGR04325 family)